MEIFTLGDFQNLHTLQTSNTTNRQNTTANHPYNPKKRYPPIQKTSKQPKTIKKRALNRGFPPKAKKNYRHLQDSNLRGKIPKDNLVFHTLKYDFIQVFRLNHSAKVPFSKFVKIGGLVVMWVKNLEIGPEIWEFRDGSIRGLLKVGF